MTTIQFSQVPADALLILDGITTVNTATWEQYLKTVIEKEYPAYSQDHWADREKSSRWRNHACILESLEEYMLEQFRVLLPTDNLFKVYNNDGEGLLPGRLIEAISSVIEPLGFEVDKFIVADAELRQGLGYSSKVFDLSSADEFDGRAGICMINIKEGYSHAFFWKCMDKRKFWKEQFRMAFLIKSKPDTNEFNS